jgi:hypothetical protein
VRSSLFYLRRIETHGFASSCLLAWLSKSPRPDMSVNADFLSPYRNFGAITTSLLTMPSSWFSNSRLAMCRNVDTHVRVDLPTIPYLVRTSDFAGSQILTPNTRDFSRRDPDDFMSPVLHFSDSLWPTLST